MGVIPVAHFERRVKCHRQVPEASYCKFNATRNIEVKVLTVINQTCNRTKPSFKNKRAFYKCIDTLPRGAKWECEVFKITGDERDEKGKLRSEVLQRWKRDTVECIKELIGNPAFRDNLRYAPQRVYEDEDGTNRLFNEMWTGDWWWDTQVSSCLSLWRDTWCLLLTSVG